MFLLNPPRLRTLEPVTVLPESRRRRERSDWADAIRGGVVTDSFLEGPVFDDQGNPDMTDISWGHVFRIDAQGHWQVIAEYDGEPNGMKFRDTSP